MAHRDGRHLDGQPSLPGASGHVVIFGAQRSVVNDPIQTRAGKIRKASSTPAQTFSACLKLRRLPDSSHVTRRRKRYGDWIVRI
jgi:hypothetical protein